ncbi:RHS repeat-associated core domain-containing protein [Pseudoxanthomonas sp. SE1]|uniref:RHS repeat domain-containing protein n=1 Tax=Pseudoxanthomonas sp. SE1 TaxID=1664560 RepID=UPI00240CFB94|nr:RHS repeat-associated core domain-containing protein [Pseudoxanthomonas sp. SE1]WFC40800.1 RHS repeat protein [Pseudoxanthomonas sp. SE1]
MKFIVIASQKTWFSVFILLCGFLMYDEAIAQVNVWDSYSEKVKAGSQIAALGPNVFGDSVDLYTGRTTFVQEDISLPGNNELPVRFARAYSPESLIRSGILGDWYPDIPRISGIFPTSTGWKSSMPGDPNRRCSVDTSDHMKATPPVTYGTSSGVGAFSSAEYWTGNDLYIPGIGSQRLVVIAPGNSNRPSEGGPYYWTTAKNYVVSCVGSTANGIAGEGFVVTSPKGIKYRFDWLARVASPYTLTLKKPITQCSVPMPACYTELARSEYWWLPTRVEDRFGNYVTYTYDSSHPERIASIQSNDGRTISFIYDASGRIATATANERTWIYSYVSASSDYGSALNRVDQPDGSSWIFDLSAVQRRLVVGSLYSDCTGPSAPGSFGGSSTGSMTSPSGAVGTFTFVQWRHGRSHVPRSCVMIPNGGSYAAYSQVVDAISLAKKRLHGPGIDGAIEWDYSYEDGRLSPSGWSYADACTSSTCPTTKVTTVAANDGTWTSYTLIKKYGAQEGLISSTATGSNQTQTRVVTETFVAANSQPWFPASVGSDPCYSCDHTGESYSVTSGTAITQDGSTFQRTVTNFDSFARPTSVTRSGPSASRSDTISYFDNTAKWVLGQVAQIKCVAPTGLPPLGCGSSGTVENESTYDAIYALPLTYTLFGKQVQTLTYETAAAISTGQRGTLKTVKDGNDNITTLSNWKRGIPQTIQFPATDESPSGAILSAVVSDLGLIELLRNEAGFPTCYQYDQMGRLSRVTYPSMGKISPAICGTDEWNPTAFDFQQVAVAEYGIPAGHWRQTISTGNARKITYFDALWRPLVTKELDATNTTTETLTKRFQRFTYDHDGRVTFASYPGATDALTTGTWKEYDALGRTTSVSQDSELGALTTLTTYSGDSAGPYTRVTDPRGTQTVTRYQMFDQPNYELPVLIDLAQNKPERAAVDITRDVFGKPLSIRKRNNANTVSLTRSYAYNAHQELCRSVEPETGATLMGYDGAGNVLWSAAGLPAGQACEAAGTSAPVAARRTDRTYDARNRIKTLTFPDGRGNQSWTYTPDGLPSGITTYNETGNAYPVVNAYTYNRRRLLTFETSGQTGWYTWGLGYTYNANGHLSAQSYPDGQSVSYAPNALGQSTQAGTYATGGSYYPNGAIKQFTYGNGIVHTMTQNARQLPARSTDVIGSSKPLDLGYTYDANGNVGSITDYLAGARQTRGMSYDGLDRLIQTTSSMFGTASYGYNALDNLTSLKVTGGSLARDHTYVYDTNNRLGNIKNTVGGATVVGLGYDPQGNLANKNGQLYSFTYGNRLREVPGKEKYLYDGHGRRVESRTTNYSVWQYSQSGQVMYSHDARNNRKTNYIYLGGSLVALRELPMSGGTTVTVKYQHTDALGTPIAVTDAAKAIVETSEYEPYGQLVNSTLKDGPGYTGHVQDAATGLTYMQQRYYDPQVGLFLSVDPVMAYESPVGMFNRYRYANNNPYRFVDSDGRQSRDLENEYKRSGARPPPKQGPSFVDWFCGGSCWDAFEHDILQYPGSGGPTVSTAKGMLSSLFRRGGGRSIGAGKQAIGEAREQIVARLTNGAVSGEKITSKTLGSTDIDVISGVGDLIAVGGAAKAGNLGNLGRVLRIYSEEAANRGVRAQAFFERGTPDAAIKLSEKLLGKDNVKVF